MTRFQLTLSQKLAAAVVFWAAAAHVNAAPRLFECRGARVSVDIPDYIDLSDLHEISCVFSRNKSNPDYSGFYFQGTMNFSEKGSKGAHNFKSYAYPSDGTWVKLRRKKTVLVMEDVNRYLRIDEGDYEAKFLAPVSPEEILEKESNIVRIEGKVLEKGVWVNLSLALPYEDLTLSKAIEIIKSVKVIKGFSTNGTKKLSGN